MIITNDVANKTEPDLGEIFNSLRVIDLTGKTKQKMNLTYLGWADAWSILKQKYPNSTYKIYTNTIDREETSTIADGSSTKTVKTISHDTVPYFTDGKTCFVKVGVVINEHEEVEYLPVMDMRNQSVKYAQVTSVDINRALQRAFVKACARQGLGLYIYAGEDLPEKDPIVLEYAKYTEAANAIDKIPAEELGKFDEHRSNVVKLIPHITSVVKDSDAPIATYIQSQITTRISELKADHFLELYRIEQFLLLINKAIGE